MLGLKGRTAARWLEQVDRDLPAILVDHAHCEKKAAGTALNLIFCYGTRVPEICGVLSEIVVEELDHFRQVLALLEPRGIRFTSLKPGGYGRKLEVDAIDHRARQRAHRVLGIARARAREREHGTVVVGIVVHVEQRRATRGGERAEHRDVAPLRHVGDALEHDSRVGPPR